MLETILRSAVGDAVTPAPALLAGVWLQDGPTAERLGPYLRQVVSRARIAQPADVAVAADYADRAAAEVSALAPAARADILDRASRLAVTHRDDVAQLIARELGKPVQYGRGELARVAETFAICAAEARQIGGDVLPVAGRGRGIGNTALTYRAPAGVALAITPFNAPANLLAHKLGASFAAGNTTIVKAPPQAPAVSAAVVALLLSAGAPMEAVQLLHGGGEVGAALCAAPQIDVISFTGSPTTGAAVARAAGPRRLVL
ncbi:MAG TPA: aldehyde dehydrogenase family protein, partial [Mycobacteriales bacterium]